MATNEENSKLGLTVDEARKRLGKLIAKDLFLLIRAVLTYAKDKK